MRSLGAHGRFWKAILRASMEAARTQPELAADAAASECEAAGRASACGARTVNQGGAGA
jgi:hypothetical protein